MMRTAMALLAFLAVTYAVAALGGRVDGTVGGPTGTRGSPSPPGRLRPGSSARSGSLLYTLMAVAAWLVWRRLGGAAGRRCRWPSTACNSASTSPGRRCSSTLTSRPGRWLTSSRSGSPSSVLSSSSGGPRPPAGGLLVPYLLWVSYALTLNYGIWRLNP